VCNETAREQKFVKIGIIGVGKIASTLGKLWVRAGHYVLFGSPHPNRLKKLVEEAGTGAYCGTCADAGLFGDVILFAPNFRSIDHVLKATGPLDGKILVDTTNPFEWNPKKRMVRSLPSSTSVAEELAQTFRGAHVVKAFSTIPASLLTDSSFRPGRLDRLVVFYCGDHRRSKKVVRRLIADSGCVGFDAGPLRLAKGLEAPGRLYLSDLVGMSKARRPTMFCASDQPASAGTVSASFIFSKDHRTISISQLVGNRYCSHYIE
jgi:8-hydroxy-5-deazaflavin:NADPH oxidoreductase